VPKTTVEDATISDYMSVLSLYCPVRDPALPYRSLWEPNIAGNNSPMHFDVLGGEDINQTGPRESIARYVLTPIESKPSSPLPSSIPILVGATVMDDTDFGGNSSRFASVELGGQDVLYLWRDAAVVKAQLSTFPTTPGGPITSVVGTLESVPVHRNSVVHKFSLCPMSGRMCMICADFEIRVLDFVSPVSHNLLVLVFIPFLKFDFRLIYIDSQR